MTGFENIENTLEKAQFIKQKSTDINFDTNDTVEKAFAKIEEEFNELKEEVEKYLKNGGENLMDVKKEMGDLLFSTSGLANKLNIKTTDCLEMTVDKFVFRTRYVEKKLSENNQDFSNGNIEQMCGWWCEAKKFK